MSSGKKNTRGPAVVGQRGVFKAQNLMLIHLFEYLRGPLAAAIVIRTRSNVRKKLVTLILSEMALTEN